MQAVTADNPYEMHAKLLSDVSCTIRLLNLGLRRLGVRGLGLRGLGV